MFKLRFSPGIMGKHLIKREPFQIGIGANQKISCWYGGAQAIYQGVRSLGLKEGDIVLAPAYSCGSEIAPLLAAGLAVEYYRSLPDLSPDFAHLEKLSRKKPKALFIIHYFGFPQPLEALLDFKRKHNLFLIEDNAHGLYSRDHSGILLGSSGDIAIFSFAKSLPITDGGALVLNRTSRTNPINSGIPPRLAPVSIKVAGKIAYQSVHNIAKIIPQMGKALQARVLDRLSMEPKISGFGESPWDSPGILDNYRAFKPDRSHWRMSSVSRFLLKHQPHQRICHVRRRNFELLLNGCKGLNINFSPVLSSLPIGVCPLLFPVQSSHSLSLYNFLRSRGVEALRFWRFFHSDYPRERFPFETALKKNVIALPIHQDISPGDVLFMVELLRKWEPDRSSECM